MVAAPMALAGTVAVVAFAWTQYSPPDAHPEPITSVSPTGQNDGVQAEALPGYSYTHASLTPDLALPRGVAAESTWTVAHDGTPAGTLVLARAMTSNDTPEWRRIATQPRVWVRMLSRSDIVTRLRQQSVATQTVDGQPVAVVQGMNHGRPVTAFLWLHVYGRADSGAAIETICALVTTDYAAGSSFVADYIKVQNP